jgi:hypothetical protein
MLRLPKGDRIPPVGLALRGCVQDGSNGLVVGEPVGPERAEAISGKDSYVGREQPPLNQST